jgi:hypothetical protein
MEEKKDVAWRARDYGLVGVGISRRESSSSVTLAMLLNCSE